MKAMRSLLALAALLCSAVSAYAQAADDSTSLIDPSLNRAENDCLDLQAQALLSLAEETLVRHPPVLPEPPERNLTLHLLDGVLHDVYAPQRTPVREFFHGRIRKAADQITNASIERGARVWKLYNHGFIVRTATVTVAFDLTRARLWRSEGFELPDSLVAAIAAQCDALFISHRHGDHADEWVAQTFLDQGKLVVAPPEVWQDRPIHARLTHLDRIPHELHRLAVQDGRQNLEVVVYPGHQGPDIENNVSLVFMPERISVAHFGDQSDGGSDFDWIDEVGDRHRVDVMLPNCWTSDIARTVKGFDPELVITGHENEMGHTIDHREPYWLTYQRKTGSDRFGGSRLIGYDKPLLVMTWGESYHYMPTTP
ncbi:MBL fold metallo-hydrolase [Candidatus Latescibacterota bacterium]